MSLFIQARWSVATDSDSIKMKTDHTKKFHSVESLSSMMMLKSAPTVPSTGQRSVQPPSNAEQNSIISSTLHTMSSSANTLQSPHKREFPEAQKSVSIVSSEVRSGSPD